jgi:hypothetical protein
MRNQYVAALSSFVHLPNNFYNEERDRFLYSSSNRLTAARQTIAYRLTGTRTTAPPNAADDPTLKPRNKTLRLRLHHVETMIEIICTTIAVRCAHTRVPIPNQIMLIHDVRVRSQAFVVWSFGISLNGHDRPSLAHVLINAAIQLVAECVQGLICSLFQVVVERQPALSVPLLRIQGFTLVVAVVTTGVWCDAIGAVLPACLGRRANSGPSWVFLTAAFRRFDLNSTALCAAFPQAVGFVQQEC